MEDERCWICGSNMLFKSVVRADRGAWIIIKCKSCLADLLVTPIGNAKNGLRKLPGKDGNSI